MSDNIERGQNVLPLDSLPKPVLQELYHAVTGKTENISAILKGNVIVTANDFERLHGMLLDLLSVYDVVVDPTVTVLIKHENGKTTTYSSWARFKTFDITNYEVTSELSIRFEILIKLPQTPRPQRCIVDVNLDSGLPLLSKKSNKLLALNGLDFAFFITFEWNTVKISIDFVDFLVAKSLSGVVEEWFRTLVKAPSRKLDRLLLVNQSLIRRVLQQLGRLGTAVFLIAYVIFNSRNLTNLGQVVLAGAVSLIIWVIAVILEAPVASKIFRRVSVNLVPSVILLTESDNREYNNVLKQHNSAYATVLGLAGTVIFALTTNVVASYIYTFLTKN